MGDIVDFLKLILICCSITFSSFLGFKILFLFLFILFSFYFNIDGHLFSKILSLVVFGWFMTFLVTVWLTSAINYFKSLDVWFAISYFKIKSQKVDKWQIFTYYLTYQNLKKQLLFVLEESKSYFMPLVVWFIIEFFKK